MTKLYNCDAIVPLQSSRAFSLTWPASMQIYWNKTKRLHKKGSQLASTRINSQRTTLEHQRGLEWPPFHCFGAPIWPQWRHVKTLYIRHPEQSQWTAFRFGRIILSKRCNPFGRFSALALTKSRNRNSETSEWFRIGIHRRPAYFDPLRSLSSDASFRMFVAYWQETGWPVSYRSISTSERGSSARTCEKLSQLSSLLSRTAHARLLATNL